MLLHHPLLMLGLLAASVRHELGSVAVEVKKYLVPKRASASPEQLRSTARVARAKVNLVILLSHKRTD